MFEIVPAVDLKAGRCVRLVQGRADAETVFSDDPVAMARHWQAAGARLLHVVAGRADAVVLDTPIQTTVALDAFGDQIRIFPGHNQPLDVKACHVGYAHMKGDEKMAEYVAKFTRNLRDSGEFDKLVEQYMTAEQISAVDE